MKKHPILFSAALVLLAIWIWSKFAPKMTVAGIKPPKFGETPVDTGTYFGPFTDPMTGQYTAPGNTAGATSYQSQPVGVQ